MDNWWLSTKNFTCWIKTDKRGIIIDTAPYLRRRIGTKLKKLLTDLRYYDLKKLNLSQ